MRNVFEFAQVTVEPGINLGPATCNFSLLDREGAPGKTNHAVSIVIRLTGSHTFAGTASDTVQVSPANLFSNLRLNCPGLPKDIVNMPLSVYLNAYRLENAGAMPPNCTTGGACNLTSGSQAQNLADGVNITLASSTTASNTFTWTMDVPIDFRRFYASDPLETVPPVAALKLANLALTYSGVPGNLIVHASGSDTVATTSMTAIVSVVLQALPYSNVPSWTYFAFDQLLEGSTQAPSISREMGAVVSMGICSSSGSTNVSSSDLTQIGWKSGAEQVVPNGTPTQWLYDNATGFGDGFTENSAFTETYTNLATPIPLITPAEAGLRGQKVSVDCQDASQPLNFQFYPALGSTYYLIRRIQIAHEQAAGSVAAAAGVANQAAKQQLSTPSSTPASSLVDSTAAQRVGEKKTKR